MRNQGYISQAEYDEAVSDDVYARIQDRKIEVASSTYSYFVDALIDQLIKDLMEQKGYTETQATNMIYKNGLQVYSTQNMSMQQIADNVINDPGYYPDNTELSISYSLAVKIQKAMSITILIMVFWIITKDTKVRVISLSSLKTKMMHRLILMNTKILYLQMEEKLFLRAFLI